MLPKHPRAQFQGERGGRGEARGEGRGFRPGRDNRGRGRGEGRPFTGGRSERAEGTLPASAVHLEIASDFQKINEIGI